MITKQLISYLFLLTILVVNVQRGVSLKCYVCTSDDEKNDCWVNPDKVIQSDCGAPPAETTTAAPATTAAPVTTAPPAPTTTAAPATTATPTTTATPATTAAPVTTAPAAPPAPATTAAPVTTAPAAPPAPATTAAPVTTAPAAPATTAAPVTTAPPAPAAPAAPGTRAAAPVVVSNSKEQEMLNFYRAWTQNQTLSSASRLKRDTASDWECVKIITLNKDTKKKTLQRSCAKKTEDACKDKANDSDNKCAKCSDKDLCNSASNIKLQLIPAFLSVFLALFFSSQ